MLKLTLIAMLLSFSLLTACDTSNNENSNNKNKDNSNVPSTSTQPGCEKEPENCQSPSKNTEKNPKKTGKNTGNAGTNPGNKEINHNNDVTPAEKNSKKNEKNNPEVNPKPLPPPDPHLSATLGFVNLGNTCFANSALKAFSALPEVEKFLLTPLPQYPGESDLVHQSRIQTQDALYQLISKFKANQNLSIQSIQNSNSSSSSSSNFTNELDAFFDSMESYLQLTNTDHDKHFAAQTNSQSNTNIKMYLRHDQGDPDEFLKLIRKILNNSDQFYPGFKEISVIKFSGYTQVNLPQDAGSAGTLQSLTGDILNLSIDENSTNSIEDALNLYFAPEPITGSNQIINESTGQKEDSIKSTILIHPKDKLPKHILIMLKKFNFDPNHQSSHKLKTPIKISREIELELFNEDEIKNKIFSSVKVKMQPTAVVVHRGGGTQSGHYVAYAYHPEMKSWMLHNDSHITPVSEAHIDDPDAYLVLYTAL